MSRIPTREKGLYLWISPYCPSQPQGKLNSFQNQKHGVLIQTWSEKAFKGIPLNRVLQFLYVGSLEITLTVPLNRRGNVM